MKENLTLLEQLLLESYRRKKKQNKCAEELGISATYLYKLLDGRKPMTENMEIRIKHWLINNMGGQINGNV
jgi:plasmid maintenance system antidote protein VapI